MRNTVAYVSAVNETSHTKRDSKHDNSFVANHSFMSSVLKASPAIDNQRKSAARNKDHMVPANF